MAVQWALTTTHIGLANRIAAFLLQQSLLTDDIVHRDMVRLLPGGNEIFTAVIEVKAARLGLGRLIAFHRQHATIFRNAEHRDDAGGTIAGVKMTAIRGDMNIRRPAHAAKIRRHHIRVCTHSMLPLGSFSSQTSIELFSSLTQ